jgi:probable HAF family extracellular repeat protein
MKEFPMQINRASFVASLWLGVLALSLKPSAQAQTKYRYTKIDVPNSILTVARGINAHGDILGGYLDADGVGHDFLLRDGVFTNIDYPGGASAGGLAMNARGDIAGSLTDADGSHGFLLSNGVLTKIDYPGATFTSAFAINNSGDVTGQFGTPAGKVGSFILKTGVFHRIPLSLGDNFARGAEDNGRVFVGDVVLDSDLTVHGFLQGAGGVQLLDPPGMIVPCSHARGINERGDVAGAFAIVSSNDECDSRPPAHGFVRFRTGEYAIIDPPGSFDTFVFGINDDGGVVGAATDKDGNVHGFRAVPQN